MMQRFLQQSNLGYLHFQPRSSIQALADLRAEQLRERRLQQGRNQGRLRGRYPLGLHPSVAGSHHQQMIPRGGLPGWMDPMKIQG